MVSSQSRRSFLRNAVPGALREATRARQALTDELAEATFREPEAGGAARLWAGSAQQLCSLGQLQVLAEQERLGHHAEAIRALATTSYRLVPDPAQARGHSVTPVSSDDLHVAFDVRAIDSGNSPLVESLSGGVWELRVSFDNSEPTARALASLHASPRAARCTVGDAPVTATAELILPRAWAEPVEALGLNTEEQDGWMRLRAALAKWQGIDPLDGTGQTHRLHRLFGYPDERSGTLPLTCELADRGEPLELDLTGPDRYELEEGAQRWALLVQIATHRGLKEETVTVWCDRERLAQGDLRRLIAVRRTL
jgi:hypothetical protein